jgi:hypothetical protein
MEGKFVLDTFDTDVIELSISKGFYCEILGRCAIHQKSCQQ